MKYMLLIHRSTAVWEKLSAHEQEQVTKDHAALVEDLRHAGEYLNGGTLADPLHSLTVRVRDAAAVEAEGPHLQSVEHLAGYEIVDCHSLDRVKAIAARIPEARLHKVEIRPIMDLKGMEM